jgi:hypothetical protein
MRYKPRSQGRKMKVNKDAILEIIIGIIAWTFVCAMMFWAIMLMLEAYTTD